MRSVFIMDLKTIDWKEIAKEAFTEVLNDMKGDAAELIKKPDIARH
jgi:hypothetical protein